MILKQCADNLTADKHKMCIVKKLDGEEMKKKRYEFELIRKLSKQFSDFALKTTCTKSIKYKLFRCKVEIEMCKQKGL